MVEQICSTKSHHSISQTINWEKKSLYSQGSWAALPLPSRTSPSQRSRRATPRSSRRDVQHRRAHADGRERIVVLHQAITAADGASHRTLGRVAHNRTTQGCPGRADAQDVAQERTHRCPRGSASVVPSRNRQQGRAPAVDAACVVLRVIAKIRTIVVSHDVGGEQNLRDRLVRSRSHAGRPPPAYDPPRMAVVAAPPDACSGSRRFGSSRARGLSSHGHGDGDGWCSCAARADASAAWRDLCVWCQLWLYTTHGKERWLELELCTQCCLELRLSGRGTDIEGQPRGTEEADHGRERV